MLQKQLACALLVAAAFAYLLYSFFKSKPVYLLGFYCYKAPDRYAESLTFLSATCKLQLLSLLTASHGPPPVIH